MELTKAEKTIILKLLEAEDYMTSYDLETAAGISRRTIRTLIPGIRESLRAYGLELESKANRGYLIAENVPGGKKKLGLALTKQEGSFSDMPETVIDRTRYIMRRLILAGTYVRTDDLADELGLSRSGIQPLMREVRSDLPKYHLLLEQKPSYGIRIEGKEADLRKALSDFEFTGFTDAFMIYDFLDTLADSSHSWENEVLRIFETYGIRFSDYALCDLMIALTIQIRRIRGGYVCQERAYENTDRFTAELQAAEEIASIMRSENVCDMNVFETEILAVMAACKRIPSETESDGSLQTILEKIRRETGVDYSGTGLTTALPPILCQLRIQLAYNEKIRTPFWDSARKKYPLAYTHARIVSKIFEKETGTALSRSQCVYLTSVFAYVMMSMYEKPLQVLLISGQDRFSEEMIRRKLESAFPQEICVCKCVQYYRLDAEKLQDYDMILSTVPVHRNLPVPYLHISQWFTADDREKTARQIRKIHHRRPYALSFHPDLFETVEAIHMKEAMRRASSLYSYVCGDSPDLSKTGSTDWIHGIMLCLAEGADPAEKPCVVCILKEPVQYRNQPVQAVLFCFDQELYRELRWTLRGLDEERILECLKTGRYSDWIGLLGR